MKEVTFAQKIDEKFYNLLKEEVNRKIDLESIDFVITDIFDNENQKGNKVYTLIVGNWILYVNIEASAVYEITPATYWQPSESTLVMISLENVEITDSEDILTGEDIYNSYLDDAEKIISDIEITIYKKILSSINI